MSTAPYLIPIIAGENFSAPIALAFNPSDGKWYRSHILAPPFRIEAIGIADMVTDEEGLALLAGPINVTVSGTQLRNGQRLVASRTNSSILVQVEPMIDRVAPYVGYCFNDTDASDLNGMLMIEPSRIRSFPFHDFYPITKTVAMSSTFYDTMVDGVTSSLFCTCRIPTGILNIGWADSSAATRKIGIVIHYTAATALSGNAFCDFRLGITREGQTYDNTGSGAIVQTLTGQSLSAPTLSTAKKKRFGWGIDVTTAGYEILTAGAELTLKITRNGANASDTMTDTLLISGVDLYI
ncbi:hypothetical protein L0152_07200 [bacterium]|nr:hypothetical protein [bacterium]